MSHRVAWTMRDELTAVRTQEGDAFVSPQAMEFLWTEGNWYCDVNRYLEFYGKEADQNIDKPDHSCMLGPGNTRRFTLLSLRYDDQELVQ